MWRGRYTLAQAGPLGPGGLASAIAGSSSEAERAVEIARTLMFFMLTRSMALAGRSRSEAESRAHGESGNASVDSPRMIGGVASAR